jgi:hypothetical protein
MRMDFKRPSCSINIAGSSRLKNPDRGIVILHSKTTFWLEKYQASNVSLVIREPAHMVFFVLGAVT